MPKQYKAVIFDLDGTLLDTLDDLASATNYALREMGFQERTREEIRCFVGNGIAKLIERAVPNGTDGVTVQKTLALFKARYAEHNEDNTAPYQGILSLLERLRQNGFLLAVVSNKIDSAVSSLCQKYFGSVMSAAVGEREGVRKKPYPDSVNEVLRSLNVTNTDAVYVGDSEVDIQTAKNAGLDCISVTWGFRDTDTLCRAWDVAFSPDLFIRDGFYKNGIYGYFADTAKELENILLSCKIKSF